MTKDLIIGIFVLFSIYAAGRVFIRFTTKDTLSVYTAIPCGTVILVFYSTLILCSRLPFNFRSQMYFCLISIFCWIVLVLYNLYSGNYSIKKFLKFRNSLLFILVPIGIVIYYDAGGTPFHGYDERATYAIKGKIIATRTTVFTEEFTNPSFVQDNFRRPLLIPIVLATVFTISGNYAETGAKLFFPTIYLCLLILFYQILKP